MPAAEIEVLKDIFAGASSSLPSEGFTDSYNTVAEFGGWVYFQANDGTNGRELWRTDGTAANTQRFLDINPGSANSDPREFYSANGRLFFSAQSPSGFGLFVTDGTPSGTIQLTTVEVGKPIGVIGSEVFFHYWGNSSTPGAFWKSDGTINGTVKFASVAAPELGGVREVVIFENTLVYDSNGGRLFRVDHVTGTQTQIATSPIDCRRFTVFNGDLYFSAVTELSEKTKLWNLASPTSTPTLAQAQGSTVIAENIENLVASDN